MWGLTLKKKLKETKKWSSVVKLDRNVKLPWGISHPCEYLLPFPLLQLSIALLTQNRFITDAPGQSNMASGILWCAIYIYSFFIAVTKKSDANSSVKEIYILAPGFRGIMVLYPKCWGRILQWSFRKQRLKNEAARNMISPGTTLSDLLSLGRPHHLCF